MKHLTLFLVCATLLSSCAQFASRTLPNPPTDASAFATMRLQTASYEKLYSRYDAVYLLSETLYDNYSGGYAECTKLCYLVLQPDNERLGTFRVEVSSDGILRDVHISVASPDGTIQTFGQKDLRSDTSSDRSIVWKFAYPKVVKGTIIEENFTVEYPGRFEWSQDVPLQMDMPCNQKRFTYAYPKWWDVQVKANGTAAPLFYNTENDPINKKTLHIYDETAVTPREWEPYSPYFKEVGRYMEIFVRSSRPLLTMSSDDTWKIIAGSYRKHILDKESLWSGKVGSVTEEITARCTTHLQKLEAVTTYIQHNIRIGTGSDDDTFSDVLAKKEASPYTITALAKKMLEKLKIPSDFILIHSAQDGHFDQHFVNPNQLYTPALYATIDSVPYVVFPYYKNVPVGMIPEPFQRQTALRINENGYNGFITTPAGRDLDNTTDEKYTLTIDEEGKIRVDEEKTLRGFSAYTVRDKLDNMKAEEIEKEMKDMLTYSEGDIKLLSHEIINRTNLREPLVIKLSYEIDNLVTVTPDEILFQTAGLLSPASSYVKKTDIVERRNPIRVRYTETLNKDIIINYPQSWNLTTPIEDKKIENSFGTLETTVTPSSGRLAIKQRRVLLKANESKSKYPELLRIVGRSSGMAVPTLVFSAHGS